MKRAWLKAASWTVVTEINRQLCAQKGAQFGETSDGFKRAQKLWAEKQATDLTLGEVATLCHTGHRLAPFLNYNGNTFVAIARQVVAALQLPPTEAAILRSLIGHIVAGTADAAEHEQFVALVQSVSTRQR